MTTMPVKSRSKLLKTIALFDSDKPGEVAAAAAAAARLVAASGLTWSQIIAPPEPKREPMFSTWRKVCAELAARPGELRPWERNFVADLPKFPRISTKQRYCLQEIANRVLDRNQP